MSNGKSMIILLIVRLILLYKMNKYFPKSFRSFGRNINVKVDLSSYATQMLKIFHMLMLQFLH